MPRVCRCDRCNRAGPYDLGQCRLCWLWWNDSRYRGLWSPGEQNGTVEASAPQTVPNVRQADCARLGAAQERRDAAGNECHCRGRWLFSCEVFETCTIGEPRAGVACCQTCTEYDP